MAIEVYVLDANGSGYLARQVGWVLSDELAVELGVDPTSDDYICTLEMVEGDGGIKPEYADRLRPIYVLEATED